MLTHGVYGFVESLFSILQQPVTYTAEGLVHRYKCLAICAKLSSCRVVVIKATCLQCDTTDCSFLPDTSPMRKFDDQAWLYGKGNLYTFDSFNQILLVTTESNFNIVI